MITNSFLLIPEIILLPELYKKATNQTKQAIIHVTFFFFLIFLLNTHFNNACIIRSNACLQSSIATIDVRIARSTHLLQKIANSCIRNNYCLICYTLITNSCIIIYFLYAKNIQLVSLLIKIIQKILSDFFSLV